MKRWLALLLAGTMFLTACTLTVDKENENGKGDPVENPIETPGESPAETTAGEDSEVSKVMVDDFQRLLEESESPSEVKAKLDSSIMEANEKTADVLAGEYVDYLKAYAEMGLGERKSLIQKLASYFSDDKMEVNPEAIRHPELKALYTELTDSGYKFIADNRSVKPIIDYRFLEKYTWWISTGMEEYARLMAQESDRPWALDGGLAIDLNELAERIGSSSYFMLQHYEFPRSGEVIMLYKMYLKGFLGGLENTPVVDGKEYSKAYLSAYEYFIKQYQTRRVVKAVEGYYKELEAQGFAAPYDAQDRDSVLAFHEGIFRIVHESAEEQGALALYLEYGMTTEDLQVRSGPDLSYPILITVPKDTIVTQVLSWKGWSKVETSGVMGYSLREYLKPVTFSYHVHRVTAGTLNLTESPEGTSQVLARIPVGTMVRIIELDKLYRWAKVSYGGFTGYVSPYDLMMP